MLVTTPDLTDKALTMLEATARRQPQDAIRWNDLAVAYSLRAEREDRPADRVRAHAAALRSLELDGNAPEARFNRALIESGLLPPYLAVASWETVIAAEKDPRWAAEARSRRAAFAARREEIREHSWEVTKEALRSTAERDDRPALHRHLQAFPGQASTLSFQLLLGEWAEAHRAGDAATAAARLTQAHRIAKGVAELTGDRLALDSVEAVREALKRKDENRLDDLVAAHAAFLESGSVVEQRARFERARSPLARLAEITALQRLDPCGEPCTERLTALARQSRQAGHSQLEARAFGHLGFSLTREVEKLAAYEEALEVAWKSQDAEAVAKFEVRRNEILLVLGDAETGWNALTPRLLAIEEISSIAERMTLFTSAAKLATELGGTELALQLLTAAIELGMSSEDPDPLQANLAIAYRARATLLLLGRRDPAAADLETAERLTEASEHEKGLRPMLLVAQAEVAAAQSKPQKALELWGSALHQFDAESPAFLRARVLFSRAEQYRKLGDTARSEDDLEAGLGLIEEEERHNLEVKPEGLGDPYFGRFSDVAEQYVTLLLDSNRAPETFLRLERGRAFEPLTRLRDLPLAPATFRDLTRGDSPLGVADLRAHLRADTALLSYSVLRDRLLVWVVTAEDAQAVVLPAGREQIHTWANAVRSSLRTEVGLSAALEAPYAALIAAPLAKAVTANRTAKIERLVLVLDEELHQIPFAALRDPQSKRYLVEDHTLSVAPSATLFLYSLLRDAEAPRDPRVHAFLVGNPAFDPRSPFARGLSSLKEAANEVQTIRSFYTSAAVVTGAEATRHRWLAELPQAAVIHYGGHAVANERDPSKSLLLLAPEGNTPGELLAGELLGGQTLPHTRLVVLAACSTAGGQPIGPLGLAPLVRPFLEAGVPGVVGTLWDVDTNAAQFFSENFHARLHRGLDAASALRQTQLAMLQGNNDHLRRPTSWAAYTLVGFASSPFPTGGEAF